jgi:hypothetical protein
VSAHRVAAQAALHPDVTSLGFLLGRWAGEGTGGYPTVSPFAFGVELTFSHVGKPFLAYAERTWDLDDGRPLHAETGYWRCPSAGTVELVVAHPTGVVEVDWGQLHGTSMALESTTVARTASAKEVSGVVRRLGVDGDRLHYELDMAAVSVSLNFHVRAALQRVSGPVPQ